MSCFLSNKDGAKPFVEDMEAGKGKARYLDISEDIGTQIQTYNPQVTGQKPYITQRWEMLGRESREFKLRLPLG